MKPEVVDLLTALGLSLKKKGEQHRARAYLHAANAIARRDDFEALLHARRLREIPGIGPKIEARIHDFVEDGVIPTWIDPDAADADVGEAEGIDEIPRDYATAPFCGAPDLHCHTTWSDGTLTIEQATRFAKRLGARALGISDHSGSLRIARGLSPAEVREQWKEIERVQRAHPDIRILRGTECDILRDGRLDHPRELLRGFDYVIGSLHSHLKLGENEQTERLLAALDDPHLTILGHPTTRVPRRRPRAAIDLARVFAKAAERGIAMEVNGNPGRIDLDAELAREALAAGCKLALGSDGHSAREMLALAEARRIAAKAGAREKDLVNFTLLSTM